MSQPARSETWQTWHDALPQSWGTCFDTGSCLTCQHPLIGEKQVCSDKPASSYQTAHAKTEVLQEQQGQLQKSLPLPHHQGYSTLQLPYPLFYGQLYHPLLVTSAACLAVLGNTVFLLDGIAGDHVFGEIGTTGRPRGHMTLDKVCSMNDDGFLSKQQQHRWLQFLQIWKAAGWELVDLVLLAEELRPLQYGHQLDQAHVATIGLQHMLICINIYGDSQGHRRFKLKEALIRLLNVVHHHFSSPDAVLVRNPDAIANVSKVKVIDVAPFYF